MTYYLLLSDGSSQAVADVTESPTQETFDEYLGDTYRNIFDTVSASVSVINGYVGVKDTPVAPSDIAIPDHIKDANTDGGVPPRPREVKRTYWKFTLAGPFLFYIPVANVASMGTSAPSI